MAGPFGTKQQPITLAEVEQQVATYQESLALAETDLREAEIAVRHARTRQGRLKRQVEAWQQFATTLKELA